MKGQDLEDNKGFVATPFSAVREPLYAGQRFGRLEVLWENGKTKHGHTAWDCVCVCGKPVYRVDRACLVTGNTKSCGCLNDELRRERNFKHGHAFRGKINPLYKIYHGIKTRCTNPKATHYDIYGGRGIKCLWATFDSFKRDMGEEFYRRWSGKRSISIERIDVHGNYQKENCRWATEKEQANNTTRNHFLTYEGKRLTLSQWGEVTGQPATRIRARLNLGFSPKEALTLTKNEMRI